MSRQINKSLHQQPTCTVNNKLFYSPTCTIEKHLNNVNGVNLDKEKFNFENEGTSSTIAKWVNQHEDFKEFNIGRKILPDTKYMLFNINKFKGEWDVTESSGFLVNVINSFTYTQDVKYEARFIEPPMVDKDFRLVVVVPNETDVLHTLFRRLTNEGLAAAFASIQPAFTVKSKLGAPHISISSETEIIMEQEFPGTALQYGKVNIDDNGAIVNVLTCIYSSKQESSHASAFEVSAERQPFFFAVTFKDMPIFAGQYIDK